MSVVQVLDHAVELEPANAEIRCKRGTFHLSMIANNTPPRPLPRNEHCLAGVADFAEALELDSCLWPQLRQKQCLKQAKQLLVESRHQFRDALDDWEAAVTQVNVLLTPLRLSPLRSGEQQQLRKDKLLIRRFYEQHARGRQVITYSVCDAGMCGPSN